VEPTELNAARVAVIDLLAGRTPAAKLLALAGDLEGAARADEGAGAACSYRELAAVLIAAADRATAGGTEGAREVEALSHRPALADLLRWVAAREDAQLETGNGTAAEWAGKTPSAITRRAKELEGRGLVVRDRSGRCVSYVTTPLGREVAGALRSSQRDVERPGLAVLGLAAPQGPAPVRDRPQRNPALGSRVAGGVP
jgi:DNA-binding MarR family transcriptional regulator